MNSEQNPWPGGKEQGLGRQPALDGIRGVAVLAVLFHHLDWPGFKGGFLGVDMFFALSGFLITTLLLEDHVRHGRIFLRRFFIRRFLRLYPALVVLVAAAVLLGLLASPRPPVSRIMTVIAAVLGYWANWLAIIDTKSWFGGINHTWSLAVEMQFYLLWALLMARVTSRRGLDWRLLGLIAAGFAVGSALWRDIHWGLGTDEHWLYAGTDMRLDAVFLGVCAGLLRGRHLADPDRPVLPALTPGKVRAIELAGVGALIALVTTLPKETPQMFLVGFTAAGGATALLIVTCLVYRDASVVARIASWPILVWFGRISYSLYLWHVPVTKFITAKRMAPLGLPPVLMQFSRMAVCVALAAGSYYLVERYFLRLKDRLQGEVPSGR